MKDIQLYQQLLCLTEEWEISNVEISFEKSEVHVFIEHKDKKEGKCPECGRICSIYDTRDERNWRHLDTMQFKTILHCKIPRINCSEHGIKTVKTGWTEKYSRYTMMFEKLAIQILLACSSHSKAKELLNLSWDEIHNIQKKAVAVDMWEPFKTSIERNLLNAKIVYDKFHIIKHLSEAVDKVRKHENKSLIHEGTDNLKQTKYIWLKNKDNWTTKQEELFKRLMNMNLKIGIAWSLKEIFKIFWNFRNVKIAKLFLKIWEKEVLKSELQPMIRFLEMINEHIDGILNYIEFNITNAVAEGINSKIQYILYSARGFRNFENYRIAILFYCGNLNMIPQNSQ